MDPLYTAGHVERAHSKVYKAGIHVLLLRQYTTLSPDVPGNKHNADNMADESGCILRLFSDTNINFISGLNAANLYRIESVFQ